MRREMRIDQNAPEATSGTISSVVTQSPPLATSVKAASTTVIATVYPRVARSFTATAGCGAAASDRR